jgi:hypothetical protein
MRPGSPTKPPLELPTRAAIEGPAVSEELRDVTGAPT